MAEAGDHLLNDVREPGAGGAQEAGLIDQFSLDGQDNSEPNVQKADTWETDASDGSASEWRFIPESSAAEDDLQVEGGLFLGFDACV